MKSHHEKSIAPVPGGTLKIDAAFHSLTVALSPSAQKVDVIVDIEASLWPGDVKAYLENLAPTFKETKDGITITSKVKGRWTSGVNRSQGKISVVMPPGMALDLKTGGEGAIRVMGDTGGKPLVCDVGSGEVVIEGLVSALKVDGGSGPVRVRLDGPCGEVALETGSGAVSLNLPAESSPAGLLETRSGGIECEFPGTFENGRKVCALAGHPGGMNLRIQTGSGAIAVTRAKTQAG